MMNSCEWDEFDTLGVGVLVQPSRQIYSGLYCCFEKHLILGEGMTTLTSSAGRPDGTAMGSTCGGGGASGFRDYSLNQSRVKSFHES